MKLSSFLEDNSGGFSSMRLYGLLWTVFLLFVWTFNCIKTNTIAPIPMEIISLYLGVVGLKTVQRFGEKPEQEQIEDKK